jgi:hypothetical protein
LIEGVTEDFGVQIRVIPGFGDAYMVRVSIGTVFGDLPIYIIAEEPPVDPKALAFLLYDGSVRLDLDLEFLPVDDFADEWIEALEYKFNEMLTEDYAGIVAFVTWTGEETKYGGEFILELKYEDGPTVNPPVIGEFNAVKTV